MFRTEPLALKSLFGPSSRWDACELPRIIRIGYRCRRKKIRWFNGGTSKNGAIKAALEYRLLSRPTGVEKYLKARLEEASLAIPKSHDLLHLLHLVAAVEPLWSSYHSTFSLLEVMQ